jgi:hypothetical protein
VAPTPAFNSLPVSGLAPLEVQFVNRSSAGADIYDWDFGDGASSVQRSPKHVYALPGRYTVTLTVSGPGGSAELVVPEAVLSQHVAKASLRNGSGVNRVAFQSTSLPVLGTSWTSEVDATPHAGAGLTVLFATSAPQQGLFLRGRELLVLLPAQGADKHFTRSAPSGGGIAHHSVALPNNIALLGVSSSVQAFVLGGGSIEFCNAIDLVLGY